MIIYNVTINVDLDATEAWVTWMKNEHISEVLGTGLFTKCNLCRLLEHDESMGITYVAQYYCNTIDDYNRYIEKFSDGMRKKGHERFLGKFTAFRTVMEII